MGAKSVSNLLETQARLTSSEMTHQDHGTGAVVFQIRRFETGFYMVQDHGDCNVHMSALALQFLIGKQYKGGARQ